MRKSKNGIDACKQVCDDATSIVVNMDRRTNRATLDDSTNYFLALFESGTDMMAMATFPTKNKLRPDELVLRENKKMFLTTLFVYLSGKLNLEFGSEKVSFLPTVDCEDNRVRKL